jgi:hypothetical protein
MRIKRAAAFVRLTKPLSREAMGQIPEDLAIPGEARWLKAVSKSAFNTVQVGKMAGLVDV